MNLAIVETRALAPHGLDVIPARLDDRDFPALARHEGMYVNDQTLLARLLAR